jgi:hypothetical protein
MTLVEALSDPKLKVQAAVAILDRGWGKPAVTVEGDGEKPVNITFMWADGPTTEPDGAAEQRAVREFPQNLIEAAVCEVQDVTVTSDDADEE